MSLTDRFEGPCDPGNPCAGRHAGGRGGTGRQGPVGDGSLASLLDRPSDTPELLNRQFGPIAQVHLVASQQNSWGSPGNADAPRPPAPSYLVTTLMCLLNLLVLRVERVQTARKGGSGSTFVAPRSPNRTRARRRQIPTASTSEGFSPSRRHPTMGPSRGHFDGSLTEPRDS